MLVAPLFACDGKREAALSTTLSAASGKEGIKQTEVHLFIAQQ